MNFKVLILATLFLTSCQTADFGLIGRGETKDQRTKEQPSFGLNEETKSLDQKKINKNKLFNTTDNVQNIRPKIGLILGPGLSYSMAHLGVLKAINDQKIPVHVVAGMGWSSLIAANFALNGAVNDMRWKAFQGSFSNTVNVGFLGGSIKETNESVFASLINQYTRGQSLSQSKISFLCPVLQVFKNKSIVFKSGSYAQVLQACMKVPPLAQTEESSWAYVVDLRDLAQQMRSMGAQKIVFINVIPSAGMSWGRESSSVDPRDKLFWAQVVNGLTTKNLEVDHILSLSPEGHSALDFKNVRRLIEDSEKKSQDYFARFARIYSF